MTVLDTYSPEVLADLIQRATPEQREVIVPFVFPQLLELDYERWVKGMFPKHATSGFAEHHHQLWRWVWDIKTDERPPAFVAIWNRGGAKSSSAEMASVALGARNVRRYGWYVSGSQDQADDHVQNIASMLESQQIAEYYPALGEKLVGKHGNSRGWRRNRVRCSTGFTIDALGLDTASRGGKLEEQRPDFIIIDDVDDEQDSPKVTAKKIATLTKAILPSGADNLVVLAIQNLIHANSVFARLVNDRADYLRRRILSGPIPALREFAYEQRQDGTYEIVSGVPTWEGFNLHRCELLLNDIGPKAFRSECQHDVNRVEGAFWAREQLDAVRVNDYPDLARVVTAVDPSGGDDVHNDEQGIVTCGMGVDGKAYVLADNSCKQRPQGWARTATTALRTWDGDAILGEPNYGGQMVENTVKTVDPDVKYIDVPTTRGKVWRAEPVAALFGDVERPDEWHLSRVKLVGSFPELEDELCNWTQNSGWSPNRADAMWIALTELFNLNGKPRPRLVCR